MSLLKAGSLVGLAVQSASAFVVPMPYAAVHSSLHRTVLTPAGSIYLRASSAVSKDEELLRGIAAIDEANYELNTMLDKLCQQPYFRLFSIDVLASCDFMPQELFECNTESCEIYPEDEHEVGQQSTMFSSLYRFMHLPCVLPFRFQN